MSDMNDFVIENGVLKKYKGKKQDVEIPSGVTCIGFQAFAWRDGLTSVTIPDSVTSIGNLAFVGCKSLTSVTIPDSVSSIGDSAFYNCSSLKSVMIGSGVVSIGKSAFYNCGSLMSLTIPDGVTSIGNSAFFGTGYFNNNSNWIDDVFYIGKSLIKVRSSISGNCEIRPGTTNIAEAAFEGCSNLTSVTIPDSVTSIGGLAFCRCFELSSVTIPDGVTSIGSYTFCSCISLKSVTIPNNVISIGASAFDWCASLTNVTIPASVISVGDGAFAACGKLQRVTISDGVKTIGKQCFERCSRLHFISIPASVQSISASAFSKTGIVSFEVSPSSKKYQAVSGMILSRDGKKLIAYPPKVDLNQLQIPETVEQIAAGAIDDRKGWLVIPKTVQGMAKKAFSKTDEWKAYVFIYNPAFVDSVPNPIFLGDLNDVIPKAKNKLVENFLHAVEYGRPEIEPYKAVYAEHIRNNPKSYLKWISKNENLFHFFVQEKLIPKNWGEKVLVALEKKNRPDLKAELLAYQQENFPQKGKDPFSLSDDDPELKRRIQKDKRREEVKNQKGIKGIAFVATGDLARFGDYNEYTGAVDRSDLKRFIEARGGYLRSAVSSKTDYLICNEPDSDSKKMKKAKELGVTIIDEKTFLKMAEE